MPSLKQSLPHIVSHGLPALFLALPDKVFELFDPIDELCELPEVIQENLPGHSDIPRGCFRLEVFREYLPRPAPSPSGTFCSVLCASPLVLRLSM